MAASKISSQASLFVELVFEMTILKASKDFQEYNQGFKVFISNKLKRALQNNKFMACELQTVQLTCFRHTKYRKFKIDMMNILIQ